MTSKELSGGACPALFMGGVWVDLDSEPPWYLYAVGETSARVLEECSASNSLKPGVGKPQKNRKPKGEYIMNQLPCGLLLTIRLALEDISSEDIHQPDHA